MTSEASGYASGMMKAEHPFNTLDGSTTFKATDVRMKYVLLPAWVLTYKGEKGGAPYYYMMNGQTGAVCGKLPLKKSKLLLCSLLVGAAVFAAMCLGGAFVW